MGSIIPILFSGLIVTSGAAAVAQEWVVIDAPITVRDEVRMMLETNIAVTDDDARFLGGRQTSCFLVH